MMGKLEAIFILAVINSHRFVTDANVLVKVEDNPICMLDVVSEPGSIVRTYDDIPTKGTVSVIGMVDTVLKGEVPAELKDKDWEAKDVAGFAGFGAATLDEWNAVGEAVFLNGMAIIRPSNNGSENYWKTQVGTKFKTQFSAFFTSGVMTKSGEYAVHSKEEGGMFLSEFYDRMYVAAGRKPLCYLGLAQFTMFEAIALSMAPTYNESLFGDNKKKYYAKPVIKIPNEFAMIIGCEANYGDMEGKEELVKKLSMLLYKNPFDKARAESQFHGHGITLKRCVQSTKDIQAGDVKEAYHLLNAARLKTAKVKMYVLDNDSIVHLQP